MYGGIGNVPTKIRNEHKHIEKIANHMGNWLACNAVVKHYAYDNPESRDLKAGGVALMEKVTAGCKYHSP